MNEDFPRFRAAAVQAAPVFLDRDATLEKALALVAETGRGGAQVVVFPEVYLPGYPYWNRLENVFRTTGYYTELLQNSVRVPGPETERLAEAARRAGVYLLIGINERVAETVGTLYNTNLLFSPEGELLLRHRKLMPTYAEKLTWGFGDGSSLRVVDTPLGKLGTLICGENANPLYRYALLAQGEQVHLTNYPSLPGGDPGGYDIGEEIRLRSANHSFEGKVFTVTASAVIDESVIARVADTEEKRVAMSGPQASFTGVFAPGGRLMTEPLTPGEEGIIYADCDLEAQVGPKLRHDIVGQYQRPDVVALLLDREPRSPLVEVGPSFQQEAMEDEESATAESNGHTGASTVDDGSGALRADETR
jgi:aliphatic nitrilase